MKDLKVKSPNGDILTVTERAFKLLYGPVHGYVIHDKAEEVKAPTEQSEEKSKRSRKVKKVEEQ